MITDFDGEIRKKLTSPGFQGDIQDLPGSPFGSSLCSLSFPFCWPPERLIAIFIGEICKQLSDASLQGNLQDLPQSLPGSPFGSSLCSLSFPFC